MNVRILFVLIVLLASVSPGLAQNQTLSCTPSEQGSPCNITFTQGSQGVTAGIFDFSGTDDGVLKFQFDTVLTTFTLSVTAHRVTTVNVGGDLTGATCIPYHRPSDLSNSQCVSYDVTGIGGADTNGIPLRGIDFRGLISMTLNYSSFAQVQIPVFGHAPGDTDPPVFSENILTSYVDENAPNCINCDEPAMGGKTPGISSFGALTMPFANNAQSLTVCFLPITQQNSTFSNNPIMEVSFILAPSNGDCSNGPFLRDKTATLSVASSPNLRFADLVNNGDANKFHFDNKNHVNVQDVNTSGLHGTYFVTIISSQFSPVTRTFTVP